MVRIFGVLFALLLSLGLAAAGQSPVVAPTGMVSSQNTLASEAGVAILREGGNAVDAAIATAFALAVVFPEAGNIGGGGFLLFQPHDGDAIAYDFREMAPAAANAEMFLTGGAYDRKKHHESHLAVGVPGTVAGLHLAWQQQGKLPWARHLTRAIELAEEGFPVSAGLAAALKRVLPRFKPYPAALAQFSKDGTPYAEGEILRQPDLGRVLRRITSEGPSAFYEGEIPALIEAEMRAHGGLLRREDFAAYEAKTRIPIKGSYRGYEIVSFPPPSSGGVALVECLNILEGYDLGASGFGTAATLHFFAEAMRRAFADRAHHLGDPDFNPDMPLARLTSKDYAASLRADIVPERASRSVAEGFTWTHESAETTHISVVDGDRNGVSLTYTLEYSYGSGIVAPGTGFLLNNEMGDFNGKRGLTTEDGLIGSPPNLAAPGKRMLSSMSPTILLKDGGLFMVTGSPGGRTIISTVAQTILNVVDFGMNAREAVDAARIHHQWFPDRIEYEREGFAPDVLDTLGEYGHELYAKDRQGAAQVILVNAAKGVLEGASDQRLPDSAAVGYVSQVWFDNIVVAAEYIGPIAPPAEAR